MTASPTQDHFSTAEDLLTTPGADIRDASQQQLTQLRELCDSSLYYFAILIFGYRDLVPHIHGRVSEVIRLWETREDYKRMMIQLSRETFKCLAIDEKILTVGGYRAAWKIQRGDQLVSLDVERDYSLRRNTVVALGRRVAPLVRVQLLSGVGLRCTPNHPLWTPHGWVQASKLKAGDAVCVVGWASRTETGVLGTPQFVEVVSVEPAGDGEIAEIEVDGNHTYIGNGIVGHNTSLVTRANSLRQLCRQPDQPIAVFNEKEDNVKRWGKAIKDVVQSSRIFHAIYPDMCPPWIGPNRSASSKPNYWAWNDLAFDLPGKQIGEPEYSWSGHGVGSATAGGHWPKIIYDDIIGRKASQSPTVMADAYDFVDKSPYLLRPAEKGRWLCVCTPWTYDDVYTHMIRNYDFKVYRRPILENGKSIFPEKLTTEELIRMMERDPIGFSSQMLLNPRPGKEQSFNPAWMRYFQIDWNRKLAIVEPESRDPERDLPHTMRLSLLSKAVIVDPAATENKDAGAKGARTGIVVVGVDPWNRLFLLDSFAARIDPWEAVRKMLAIVERWKAPTLAIEENGVGKVYLSVVRQEIQRRGVPVGLRPVSSKARADEKDARIVGLIPDFRDGNWFLCRDSTEEVVTELLEYPFSRTRDLIDAMGYSREVLRRPYTPEEAEYAWHRRNRPFEGRDPITGY